ncbi:hypothetical protein EDD17DRAFT_1766171 [Pisolithus thermaeus]|nr:hypothetical protein EV401DRAFT_2069254 [Pisolithus croceorrhizus]KAI6150106.1 hypothetical protein EDD17DRAFT_1766171 [Pisolithus thermaeus]
MDLAEKALNGFSRATAVGAFVADHISIRTSTFDGAGWSTGFPAAYVPEWFPDTDFEVAGVASTSFTSDLLERKMSTGEEHGIKWTTGTVFASVSLMISPLLGRLCPNFTGGTVSSNYAFFLATTLHRKVQKKV